MTSQTLSRKRCCDTTPDYCQEGRRLAIFFKSATVGFFASRIKTPIRHTSIAFKKSRGVGGIPGRISKKIHPTLTLAPKFASKMSISDLSASIQPQTLVVSSTIFKTGRTQCHFFQINNQFDRDKCMSEANRRFWIRQTVILRFSSNLHSFFRQVF